VLLVSTLAPAPPPGASSKCCRSSSISKAATRFRQPLRADAYQRNCAGIRSNGPAALCHPVENEGRACAQLKLRVELRGTARAIFRASSSSSSRDPQRLVQSVELHRLDRRGLSAVRRNDGVHVTLWTATSCSADRNRSYGDARVAVRTLRVRRGRRFRRKRLTSSRWLCFSARICRPNRWRTTSSATRSMRTSSRPCRCGR